MESWEAVEQADPVVVSRWVGLERDKVSGLGATFGFQLGESCLEPTCELALGFGVQVGS